MAPRDAVMRNEEAARELEAITLDGSDNFLVGYQRQGGSTFQSREAWWQQVVSIYLDHIDALLQDALIPSTANSLPSAQVEIGPLVVSQLETYWEMESGDAISAVHSIGDWMESAAGRVSFRRHAPELRRWAPGQTLNSLSMEAVLNRTTKLAIYAKTPTVIRFEVRYRKDVRDTAARGLRGPVEVIDVLDSARGDAARRLSRVIRALQSMRGAPVFDREQIVRLVCSLHRATGGDDVATTRLTTALINVGGVSRTPEGGIAPSAVLERLQEHGILKRVRVGHGGTPRYALTSRYHAARLALLNGLPDRKSGRR